MKTFFGYVVPLAILGGVIYVVIYLANHRPPQPVPTRHLIETQAPIPPPTPDPAPSPVLPVELHPLPRAKKAKPGHSATKDTQALDSSDSGIFQELAKIFDNSFIKKSLLSDDFIKRFVVTLDSCTRKQLPRQASPIKKVSGHFLVTTEGDKTFIDRKNFQRYEPYISVLKKVNPDLLVKFYTRYYSLFDTAYKDLGSGPFFNDRVVEIIDSILATPEVSPPIEVFTPAVYYRFSDPLTEKLPACQKILLRMGPNNAAIVKEKLNSIRKLLVQQ